MPPPVLLGWAGRAGGGGTHPNARAGVTQRGCAQQVQHRYSHAGRRGGERARGRGRTHAHTLVAWVGLALRHHHHGRQVVRPTARRRTASSAPVLHAAAAPASRCYDRRRGTGVRPSHARRGGCAHTASTTNSSRAVVVSSTRVPHHQPAALASTGRGRRGHHRAAAAATPRQRFNNNRSSHGIITASSVVVVQAAGSSCQCSGCGSRVSRPRVCCCAVGATPSHSFWCIWCSVPVLYLSYRHFQLYRVTTINVF